jgi:RimJ/RimL family protein N-acetyltransferase
VSPDFPLGDPVDFRGAASPAREALVGRYVVARPLDAERDADALYAASHPPEGEAAIWTYLPYGPYASAAEMRTALMQVQGSADPLFFTLIPEAARHPAGVASYLRIDPGSGAIEIGHIWFGTIMQRTRAATEAIYLLARHAFEDLGYRRLEWKCNALNVASRRAALRFGFTFEGIFRQHMVVKGRNRDSAWYAIVDGDWPRVRSAFESWLDPENFDARGQQRRRLGELMSTPRSDADPRVLEPGR